MLILHIGAQKTGSTAIQASLLRNVDLLEQNGIILPRLRGKRLAHNLLAQELARTGPGQLTRQVFETAARETQTDVLLSSEMLFRGNLLAALLGELPDALRDNTRIICYVRRQDHYFESLFKQKLKNARCADDPWQFWQDNKADGDFLQMLEPVCAALGSDKVSVRVFDRKKLENGDVVDDFYITLFAGFSNKIQEFTPEKLHHSNPSFSLEFTRALNRLKRTTSFNTREVIRHVQRHQLDGIYRSRDVFTAEQCREILAYYADSNAALARRFFPDLDTLFDENPFADDTGAKTGTETLSERLTDSEMAQLAIFSALENLR